MTTVNYANTNIDQTVRVFDSFYDYDANIPASEYDIVHSYFLSVMKTKQAAGNFTVSLFRVAEQTQIPALTLLQQMQANSGLNIDASLAYYLNNIRSRATLLGVGAPSVPNFYQARNLLP
jgi:pyruvate/2-oxoacid:ferredoxin oxidoreductase alpha subunit